MTTPMSTRDAQGCMANSGGPSPFALGRARQACTPVDSRETRRRIPFCFRIDHRGRRIFGELIPYDALWRTGANEPTLLHLPFRARVAELDVPKGRYSLYTIPSRERWTLVLNRATRQWGLTRDEMGADGKWYPNAYREWIAAAELGRADIETRAVPHVEQLTARAEADRLLLSLDFRGAQLLGPPALLEKPTAWPDRIICMTLERVGSGSGVDFGRLADLKRRAPQRSVYAAGGVKGEDDLARVNLCYIRVPGCPRCRACLASPRLALRSARRAAGGRCANQGSCGDDRALGA